MYGINPRVSPHERSGWQCLVGHADGVPCEQCRHCRKYIRPGKLADQCEARSFTFFDEIGRGVMAHMFRAMCKEWSA